MLRIAGRTTRSRTHAVDRPTSLLAPPAALMTSSRNSNETPTSGALSEWAISRTLWGEPAPGPCLVRSRETLREACSRKSRYPASCGCAPGAPGLSSAWPKRLAIRSPTASLLASSSRRLLFAGPKGFFCATTAVSRRAGRPVRPASTAVRSLQQQPISSNRSNQRETDGRNHVGSTHMAIAGGAGGWLISKRQVVNIYQ